MIDDASPIKIAIAGSGFGLRTYAPLMRDRSDLQFAGILRPWKNRLGDQPIEQEDLTIFSSIEKAKRSGVQALILACPPRVMFELAQKALTHDLHILLEKPCCASAKMLDELLQQNQNSIIMPAYQLHHIAHFKSLLSALSDQQSGQLNIVWEASSWAQANEYDCWKVRHSGHGGVMSTLGVHIIWLLMIALEGLTLESCICDRSATQKWLGEPADAAADTITLQLSSKQIPEIKIMLSNKAGLKPLHAWSYQNNTEAFGIINQTDDYTSGFRLTGLPYQLHGEQSATREVLGIFSATIMGRSSNSYLIEKAHDVLKLVDLVDI